MENVKAHEKRMRQLICSTLASLIEEKSFSKITVQDILNRAEIQRATFYRYYRDKYEAAEHINHFLTRHYAYNFFARYYLGKTLEMQEHLEFWQQYRPITQKMIRIRVEKVDLLQELQDTFIGLYQEHFKDSSDYEAYLAAHNFITMLIWQADYVSSPLELSEILYSDAQIQWLSRYHNIPADKFAMFIEENEKR